MYLDTVVVSGIVIMILTCVVVAYVGVYAYKHIKEEGRKYDEQMKNEK